MSRKTKMIIAVISIFAVMGMTACGNKDNSSSEATTSSIAEDSKVEEKKPELLKWTELSKLDTYKDFRAEFDKAFEIKTEGDKKSGCLYIDTQDKETGNSTLFYALSNKTAREHIAKKDTVNKLKEAVKKEYTDLNDADEQAAVYNAYFDILPSDSDNIFNGSSTLTRSQAMALVMRASTPVTSSGEPDDYKSFTDKVGLNSYTPFAAAEDKNVYLSTETGLDSTTAEGSMTRGEYVYLVMTSIYGTDAISKVDTTKSKLTDCTELKDATGTNAEILTESLKTPTNGAPTEIVKALVKAQSLGAIDPETRWDEAITKTEAIDIYVNSVYKYAEDKQIQIEKEEAEKLKTQYTDEAKKFYKEDKSDKKRPISCKEDEYVKHYIGVRPTMTADEAHEETHDFFAHAYAEEENAKKQEEERKKKEEEEKKQQEQQNNDNGNNNGGNGGGNQDNYNPPSDNGGGNGGGNQDTYTPPSDNGGGGNDNGGNNNGGGGNQDTYTPPSDNGGGNDQVDPGGVPDPSADGWDDLDPDDGRVY